MGGEYKRKNRGEEQAFPYPVLVTGVQLTRLRGEEIIQPKDLGWLDPCRGYRDEGSGRL